jgi:hypothetical protein
MKKSLSLIICLVAFSLLVSNVICSNSYAGYSYTSIDYPGASGTEALGINNDETVVGSYIDTLSKTHGFILKNGSFTAINYPGSTWTKTTGINDSGTMVGSYKGAGVKKGVFSLTGSSFTPIYYPSSESTYVNSNAINDTGIIAGGYGTQPPDMDHCFIWNAGSFSSSFSYNGARTWANGINDSGTIVGGYFDNNGYTQTFSWINSAFTLLGYPGARETEAMGISNSDNIVGYYVDNTNITHGFILISGIYTSIDFPGADETRAVSIIDNGIIVGVYSHNGTTHGFIATPLNSQNTLTITTSGTGSGTITSSPSGINCGSTCSASFSQGTVVTLTATAAPGSTFTGWGAPCSGTGQCTVTLTSDTQITATFDASGFLPAEGTYVLYDNFSSTVIDTSRWFPVWFDGLSWLVGNPGHFSEHDGKLYYDSTVSNSQGILSSPSGIPCISSVYGEFSNFTSTASGMFGLSLGPSTNHVNIFMTQSTDGTRIFNSNRNDSGGLLEQGRSVSTTANHALFKIDYKGGTASLYYNEGTNPMTDWHWLWSTSPGWGTTDELVITVFGGNGTSSETSFQVDNIEYTNAFSDVPSTHWAASYVTALYDNAITTGYGGTSEFKPDYDVTRDQMAAFIIRAKEGEPEATYCDSGCYFSDVDTSGWACKYIQRLYDLSITTGYGGTNQYRPELIVTRDQMAAFIIRALEPEPASDYCDSGSPFADVSISSWSCRYIKRLYERGITTGYGGTNQYRPEQTVTRAQMAAFIGRAFLGMD